jgi:mono/diheme cytochrome c family protein
MGKFILGVIIGIVLVPISVYYYFASGRVPVATSGAPLPFEHTLVHAAMKAAVREAPQSPPLAPSEAIYLAGARVFRDNCAGCHGSPGHPSQFGRSEYPQAPQLFEKDEMVTDDPPGATYWKVKNGIRLSGMPGFGRMLSDEQMWQVSLLLAHADKIPPAAAQELAAAPPASK